MGAAVLERPDLAVDVEQDDLLAASPGSRQFPFPDASPPA
jgi:hypothetical protein